MYVDRAFADGISRVSIDTSLAGFPLENFLSKQNDGHGIEIASVIVRDGKEIVCPDPVLCC